MQSNRLVYVLNNVWEEEVEGRQGMLLKTKAAPTFPHILFMMTGKEQHRLLSDKPGDKNKPQVPVNFYLMLFKFLIFFLIADCLDKTQICYKPKEKTTAQSFPEEPQLGGTSADLWPDLCSKQL